MTENESVMVAGVTMVEDEIVLVETISTFRHTYAVRVPAGDIDLALNTVAEGDLEEVSQNHIGEQIVSHRTVSEQEYLKLFDERNDYLKTWSSNKKLEFIKDAKNF